jgi:predicted transcriptional regulator with HTH domain
VKQDLIDNDILESVPKTMKAKVQLLFYIHNIYIFLTHLPTLINILS